MENNAILKQNSNRVIDLYPYRRGQHHVFFCQEKYLIYPFSVEQVTYINIISSYIIYDIKRVRLFISNNLGKCSACN